MSTVAKEMECDLLIGTSYAKFIRAYFRDCGLMLEMNCKLYNPYGIVVGSIDGFQYDLVDLKLRIYAHVHHSVKDIDGSSTAAKWGAAHDFTHSTPEDMEVHLPVVIEVSREWMANAKVN